MPSMSLQRLPHILLASMRVLCGVCTQHPSPATGLSGSRRAAPRLVERQIHTACQIRLKVLRHHDVKVASSNLL